MAMETRITIAQALRELRAQIIESSLEGENAPLRFIPKSVEVELGISFDVETEAGGGVKLLSLLDLSAKAQAGTGSTHKVKLTLELVGRDGESPVLIRDNERDER